MATFDASKIRAGQLFKKNATSFSPTQQPGRSYSQIFSKLFTPSAPAATPKPQSIQSPFVQNAPITPLGQIGAKLPVGAQDVSPGVNAQAGLANAVQKQMQPAASAIATKPASATFSAPDATQLANMVSSLQVQPGSNGMATLSRTALGGVDTTVSQDTPPLPPPGPVVPQVDTGLTAAQIAAGIGNVAYQAYLSMGGTLPYDAWQVAMSNQEGTTTTGGAGDGGTTGATTFPTVSTFIPDPSDPRLQKIAAYYDEAGKAAIEENNQAAAAMSNRMRQTGGTGTMFTINAALTENADNLLSGNAKTRSATAVAKAQSLAQTTLEIANQNFENALNVANYLPENMRAGYMGSIFEAVGQHLGLSPEQIAATINTFKMEEWTDRIYDVIDAAFGTSGATNESVAQSLVGREDYTGTPLTYEAALALVNERRLGVAAPATQPTITYGPSTRYFIRDGNVYTWDGDLVGTDNGFGVLIGINGEKLGRFNEPNSSQRTSNGSKIVFIEKLG